MRKGRPASMVRPSSRFPTTRSDAMTRAAFLAVCAFVAAALVSCGGGGVSSANTLHVIGGSELKDMVPILDAAQKATGVKVVFTYTGSLSGADQIASGTSADAAWFASDKYIA